MSNCELTNGRCSSRIQTKAKGQLKLVVCGTDEKLTVTLLSFKHLALASKFLSSSIHIYVKLSLAPDIDNRVRHRTTLRKLQQPITSLHETFEFDLKRRSHRKRLLISVWCTTGEDDPSSFVGCMSFGLRNIIAYEEVRHGWYLLLRQAVGRNKHQIARKHRRKNYNSCNNRSRNIECEALPEILANSESLLRARGGQGKNSLSLSIGKDEKNNTFPKPYFDCSAFKHCNYHACAKTTGLLDSWTQKEEGMNKRRRISIVDCNSPLKSNSTPSLESNLRVTIDTSQSVATGASALLLAAAAERSDRNGVICNSAFFRLKDPIAEAKRDDLVEEETMTNLRHSSLELAQNFAVGLAKAGQEEPKFSIKAKSKSFSDIYLKNKLKADICGTSLHDLSPPKLRSWKSCSEVPSSSTEPPTPVNSPLPSQSKEREDFKSDLHLDVDQTIETGIKQSWNIEELKSACYRISNDDRGYHSSSSLSPPCGRSEDDFQHSMANERSPLFDLQSRINTKECETTKTTDQNIPTATSFTNTERTSKPREEKENKLQKRRHSLKMWLHWPTTSRRGSLQNDCLKKSEEEKGTNTKQRRSSGFGSSRVANVDYSNTDHLHEVLRHKTGIAAFRSFLASEYSEENIDFWLECEAYKSVKESKSRKVATKIYARFLDPNSLKEVNLNAEILKELKMKMKEPMSGMFEDAQQHIYQLMEKDSFPRFLNSKFCSTQ